MKLPVEPLVFIYACKLLSGAIVSWANIAELVAVIVICDKVLAAIWEMQSADLGCMLEFPIDVWLGLPRVGCPDHAGSWPGPAPFVSPYDSNQPCLEGKFSPHLSENKCTDVFPSATCGSCMIACVSACTLE